MNACITPNMGQVTTQDASFMNSAAIGRQAVGQFAQQPVSHNLPPLSGHTLPEALRDKLPGIEAIERELGMDGFDAKSSDAGTVGE